MSLRYNILRMAGRSFDDGEQMYRVWDNVAMANVETQLTWDEAFDLIDDLPYTPNEAQRIATARDVLMESVYGA